jgi:hypothetical protein
VNESALKENLLFAWEPARSRRFAIFGFLAASLAGHALCFYLFQIVYPPTVALLPPPARVNFISDNSEEGRTLLRWVAAEDPSLATTTVRPAEKAFALPPVNHVPSYLTTQPALKTLPRSQPDLRMPSSQPPGPVPIARARTQPVSVAVPTTIVFSNEVDSLGALKIPSMKFSSSIREPPQSATFRVGVTNRGAVRYCFLQSSSGDAALDEQAHAYLVRCRFGGAKNSTVSDSAPLQWALATISWGNDITPPSVPSGESRP